VQLRERHSAGLVQELDRSDRRVHRGRLVARAQSDPLANADRPDRKAPLARPARPDRWARRVTPDRHRALVVLH
jgi:hypothetical protein